MYYRTIVEVLAGAEISTVIRPYAGMESQKARVIMSIDLLKRVFRWKWTRPMGGRRDRFGPHLELIGLVAAG